MSRSVLWGWPRHATIGETAGAYSLQVVWPFRLLDPDYKLITYSILPVFQVPPESLNGDTTVGLGDASLSFFVAPTKSDSFMWGVGYTVTLPTRYESSLGSNRVGLGPTGVRFYDQKKWSAGVVLQNVWSMGGLGVNEFNEFSAQYILNYNLPQGWYLYSNSTIIADWTEDSSNRWTVPVGLERRPTGQLSQVGVELPARAALPLKEPHTVFGGR